MHFKQLNLISPLLSALETKGYTTPTPIQAAAIPPILEERDLLGCAQTGTGKTAAFALPILQLLHNAPKNPGPGKVRSLILAPTRELALQIEASFTAYGKDLDLRSAVVFGGVSDVPQRNLLRRGLHILVATPGRLLDLLSQRCLTLSEVEIFVLDEADRMLDMGFVNDVRKIKALLPPKRQTLLFSATMPPEIRELANGLLKNQVEVQVTPASSTAERIDQRVYFVEKSDKSALLGHVLKDADISRVLVFTRTKHGADKLRKVLERYQIPSEAVHGNKSQNARVRALSRFKSGDIRVLIATDIAARGIDVEALSHVVNYDLPEVPETYVHRIGRTARAGASGIALSFCAREERGMLQGIERLIRIRLPEETVPREIASMVLAPMPASDSRNDSQRQRGDSGRARQGQGEGRRQPSNRSNPRSSNGGSNGGNSRNGNRRNESPDNHRFKSTPMQVFTNGR